MSNIKIVTDSAADIPPELAYELGIEVVPLLIRVGKHNYRAGIDISANDVYTLLQDPQTRLQTIAPSSTIFEQTYRQFAVEYDHIFSLHHSNRMSATYHEAKQACMRLPASLTRIELTDSRSTSLGLGKIALAAAKAAQNGAEPYEVQQIINSVMRHTHTVFLIDTIDYLEQSGWSLSIASHVLSSMQRIKPLMLLDDGDLVLYERTRTRAKAIEGLFTFVEDFPQVRDVMVLYSTTPDDIDKLLEKIEVVFPSENVYIAPFGATNALNLGPGSMAVVVFEGFNAE